MTELYSHEGQQQEELSNQSTIKISRFSSSTNNHSYINKNLNDHNNENDIYKEAFVVPVTQHWKLQTSDEQQSVNNQFSQTFIDPRSLTQSTHPNTVFNMSNENLSTYTDKNSNKDELPTIIDESEKPAIKMKKRNTPIPKSHPRRRHNLNNTTILNESSNSQVLTNHNKTKFLETNKSIKKTQKSIPVFIPPKKPPTQSYIFSSIIPFDDSLQIKQKSINKQQNTFANNNYNNDDDDDHNSSSIINWTPSSSTSPVNSHMQSSSSLDDENSDDESLFIQKTKSKIKDRKIHSSFPTYCNIPVAIFITDPTGHSYKFNPDTDILEKYNNDEVFDDDLILTDTNALFPNTVYDISSSPDVTTISPVSSTVLDRHSLQSIGEEEDEEGSEHDNHNIFSKELDRIEALARSREMNFNPPNKDHDHTQHKTDKELVGRRWSDGDSGQEDEERTSTTKSSMMKTSSAISITKPSDTIPVKLSITKYILMKLHLKSVNKDDESNISSSTTNSKKKRTVRHSRTKLSPINDSNSKSQSNTNIYESSNNLASNELIQREKSTTDSIQSTNNSYRFNNNNNNKPTIGEKFGSVGNLDRIDSDDDDDIDGNFEKAKLGSLSSINTTLSEKKAHYGLDISGTIELKLTYTISTGALDILIYNCKNLARAKRNQTSDPYVKVYLLPDRSKNSKRKTSTKKNTIDPVFEDKLRYHVTKQEFETRVLWISVWSQAILGQNNFLGEIHIPLSNCTLDKTQQYQLLAEKQKNDLTPIGEPTVDSGEIQFQLTFIENPKHKDIGTLQVHYIQGKAIFYGKRQVDAICKGVLMPDYVKRKIPAIRKGPTPKWEMPLRWDGVRRDNLENISIEISIWSQERFRTLMIGFVRLNLARGHFDNKPVKWSDATKVEKSAWESFLRRPTEIHHFRLPLRPATTENK
ncbi:unnamed protein product [Rotaria sp. Silwood2]|nr:unnamed protein product [Rotaria sp. Silwood2]CAF3866938.1 unnamed protein product [Rotaria sp. Silwood2]CAF4103196.1 unnamed protein product [Rotaria sp. Silwood2]